MTIKKYIKNKIQSPSFKNTIRILIGLLISGIALFFAILKIEFKELVKILFNIDFNFFIIGSIIIIANYFIKAIMMFILLKKASNIYYFTSIKSLMVSFMGNNIFPLKLGEFIRAYYVGKNSKNSYTTVFAAIIIEHLADFISLIILIAFLIFFSQLPSNIILSGSIILLILFLIVIFITLCVAISNYILKILQFLFKIIPSFFHNLIEKKVTELIISLKKIPDIITFVKLQLLSFSVWGCICIGIYFYFLALNIPTNFFSVILVLVSTNVSLILPQAPAGIGVHQWICVTALSFYNIKPEYGFSLSILIIGMHFIFTVIPGSIIFFKSQISFLRIIKEKNYI